MSKLIPIEVKKTCCKLYAAGKTPKQIYDEYFSNSVEDPARLDAFRAMLNRWSKHNFPDTTTLECGTYEGFTAHDATVQVSASGEIIQAWIKQKAGVTDPEAFVKAIREAVEPVEYKPCEFTVSKRMLEIPLFDMHWGIAYRDHYEPVLHELLELIGSRKWDRIVIPFGQDFFHNDSIINATTTKGTPIEKVDMIKAVKDGTRFMYSLIDAARADANYVEVIYTPGNHDTSTSWMFTQALLARYRDCENVLIDDSLEYRKVVSYGYNTIMITHGESRKATAKDLAHIFPIAFPNDFADANVREVHAGHLHHEAEADIFGVMVRRLSSGGKIDDWSNKEGFVGAHRRFMIFEWDPYKLKSIHYI